MFNLVPRKLRKLPQVKPYNWLIHELMVRYLTASAQEHATGTLVDIGCGKKPFLELFAPHVDQHIGVDLADSIHGTEGIDVVGTAYETNLESESCKTILCSEVLEHLEEPKLALIEMNRILEKGGKVILTVPFFWPVHEEPRDFYRYTEYGLRYLFENASLDIIKVTPLTGFWAMAAQMFVYGTLSFGRWKLLRPFVRLGHHLLQHMALLMTRYDKKFKFANLYGVVAVKRENHDGSHTQ